MAKKKKGAPKKIKVKTSEPHRRKGHWVSGYFMTRSKPFRIKTHTRYPKRTKEQIEKKGTRKEERKRKRKGHQKVPKTRQKKIYEFKKSSKKS